MLFFEVVEKGFFLEAVFKRVCHCSSWPGKEFVTLFEGEKIYC